VCTGTTGLEHSNDPIVPQPPQHTGPSGKHWIKYKEMGVLIYKKLFSVTYIKHKLNNTYTLHTVKCPYEIKFELLNIMSYLEHFHENHTSKNVICCHLCRLHIQLRLLRHTFRYPPVGILSLYFPHPPGGDSISAARRPGQHGGASRRDPPSAWSPPAVLLR